MELNIAAPASASRSRPPDGFAVLFREMFRQLVRLGMYAGGTRYQAEEAAQMALIEVLRRWDEITDHRAYARRATVTNFIKVKQTGLDRVRDRQVRYAAGLPEGRPDDGLTLWSDRQWVLGLLDSLPVKQREAMAFLVDGFSPGEIATMLGRTPEAVRQSLREARLRLKRTLELERATERDAGFPGKEAR